jgi:hypothetical protein
LQAAATEPAVIGAAHCLLDGMSDSPADQRDALSQAVENR